MVVSLRFFPFEGRRKARGSAPAPRWGQVPRPHYLKNLGLGPAAPVGSRGKAPGLKALVAILLAALFSADATAATPPTIRIGVATAGLGGRPFCALSYVCVAHVQGLLEKEFAPDGTHIDWHFYSGAGPAVNEALAGGQLDFAWQGDLPSVVARSLGLKTRLLMASGGRLDYYIAVPAASPVHSLADLRGRRLALFKGTNIQTVGTRILESEGLTTNDVQLVNLDPATALAALASGQIDATLLSFWGFGLHDTGKIRFICSTENHSPKLTAQAALLVTQDFSDQHPQTVERVVAAFLRAARWSSDEANRQALYALYAKTGYPDRFFADALNGHKLLVQNDPNLDQFNTDQYRDVAALALRVGLIRRAITVDDWFLRAPLQQALAQQGLTNFWPRFAADGTTAVGE
jgi:sulfonate transport system substrate-binding protein